MNSASTSGPAAEARRTAVIERRIGWRRRDIAHCPTVHVAEVVLVGTTLGDGHEAFTGQRSPDNIDFLIAQNTHRVILSDLRPTPERRADRVMRVNRNHPTKRSAIGQSRLSLRSDIDRQLCGSRHR